MLGLVSPAVPALDDDEDEDTDEASDVENKVVEDTDEASEVEDEDDFVFHSNCASLIAGEEVMSTNRPSTTAATITDERRIF